MKTTTTNWRDLLPHYCEPEFKDCIPDSHTFGLSQPWLMDWRGSTWTVACNGYWLLLVEGKHADEDAPTRFRASIAKLLEGETQPAEVIDLPTLKEWLGEPHGLTPVTCKACMGDGTDTCPHCEQEMDCEDCGGAGTVLPLRQREPGYVRGRLIDKGKLAHLLRGCDGEASVEVGEQYIWLYRGERIAVLMEMHSDSEEFSAFEELENHA